MTAVLAWLLSNPTVLAIVGGILAAFGFGWQQRRAGAKAERTKQAQKDTKAIKQHKDIRDETGRLSDTQLDAVNEPWVRNGKR